MQVMRSSYLYCRVCRVQLVQQFQPGAPGPMVVVTHPSDQLTDCPEAHKVGIAQLDVVEIVEYRG